MNLQDANIEIVSSSDGDWVGIYVNGQLKDEGHSLTPSMVLAALGLEHSRIEVEMDAYEFSSLPEDIADLP